MRKLSESIWSNINKRSEGGLERKEDDVDLLDLDSLYDYIKSRYEKRVFYLDKDWYDDICVDILSNVSLIAKPISNNSKSKLRHILLSWSRVRIRMSLFDKLSELFNVENINPYRRIITEKDATCTNKTFIKLIDFFLENIDNILIKESIWTNINKRSEGSLERKEDSVDSMDRYGFFDYLNKIYRTMPPSKIRSYDEFNSILVPLFGVNGAPLPPKHLSIEMEYNDSQDITIGKMLMGNFPAIEKDLRDNFNVEDMPASVLRGKYLKIHPKDGSPVTNTFFITVIDFLLKKAKDKYTIILFKK